MRKAKLIIVLLAFSFTLTLNLTAKATTDEWVTATLDEDLFFASYLFDGVDMVYLQGDDMQIRSWLRFEGPVIQYGRYIVEAYLSVKIASVGGYDPGASMTIYGVPSKQGGAVSYYDDPDQINGPYTNSYNVNLSSFVNIGGWHNITVTNILREINQGYYHYDGHDVAFVTLSTSGHDAERTIRSEESGNAAKLYIHYGAPDKPPGLPDDAEYVEDYRNYTIWKVDHLGENRTGEGFDVNWNLLNVTQLTEIDSGSDLTRNNATWITVIGYQDQVHGCIYNDTGSANIESFFLRFKINVTNVNNIGAGNIPVPGVGGLSTATPVGGGGLPWGGTGDWIGLIIWIKDDDQSWRFVMREYKQGVGSADFGFSPWVDEGSGNMLYVEFRANVSGATKWMSYDVYDDPEFTNSINYDFRELVFSTGPYRYAQILPALDTGAGNSIWEQYYTYLDMPLEDDEEWFAVDPNGTVIPTWNGENCTTIECLKEEIDKDKGYPDPEDPNPPGWDEESWLSASRFKLILFIVGMVLFVGSPVYGFAERPEAATWILLMMNMIVGVALLWSLQTM